MRDNPRLRTLGLCLLLLLLLAALALSGLRLASAAQVTDLSRKNLPPSLAFPFGTDFLGRDMLARTLAGLSLSLRLGLLTACLGMGVAFLVGVTAGFSGGRVDALLSFGTDLLLGIPHMLLLILVAFACGRGLRGVVIAISLTHWMSQARLLRAETLQLSGSAFVLSSAKLGVNRTGLLGGHLLPHLWPQVLVGWVLLFPHAILHEASLTFLGFGLPAETPAIGGILSESMRYLATGQWWLAVFPGLSLVTVLLLFSLLGQALRRQLNPATAQGGEAA